MNQEYFDLLQNYNFGSSIIANLVSLALSVLQIVALWMLYDKAGQHGWAAIVPFYSSYTRFKISGKKNLFWASLVAELLTLVVTGYMIFTVFMVALVGGNENEMIIKIVLAILLLIVLAIVDLVLTIIMWVGFAKAFGHGGGFAVGLIFLSSIFLMVLAFNPKTEFVGFGGKREDEAAAVPVEENDNF